MKETIAETKLIENFTPFSCRSASTTEAFNTSLDILDILRKACWSNAKTYLQHYKKKLLVTKEQVSIKSWNIEYLIYL